LPVVRDPISIVGKLCCASAIDDQHKRATALAETPRDKVLMDMRIPSRGVNRIPDLI
jgi:hypothetical protein